MITSRLMSLTLPTRSSSLALPSGFRTDLSKSKNASAAYVTLVAATAGAGGGAGRGGGRGRRRRANHGCRNRSGSRGLHNQGAIAAAGGRCGGPERVAPAVFV